MTKKRNDKKWTSKGWYSINYWCCLLYTSKWFRTKMPVAEQFNITLDDSAEAIDYLQNALSENQIEILNIKVKKTPGKGIDAKIYAKFPKEYEAAELLGLFRDNPHILSVDF